MPKTKLISLNIGVRLTVLRDGQEKMMSYSALCPSKTFNHPSELLQSICDYINEEFGTNYHIQSQGLRSGQNKEAKIEIAKLKEIKAQPSLTQDEFNKKIKELIP